jgi:ATP-dependent DNA ligase
MRRSANTLRISAHHRFSSARLSSASRPADPPFVNSTPADSRARQIAARLFGDGTRHPSMANRTHLSSDRLGWAARSHISASGWIEPCKAVLVKQPPAGPNWLHEIKHDGYRVIASIAGGRAKIYTRRGLDWSARMPTIKAALEALRVTSAVIDGEAIMAGEDGISDFFALHERLANGSAPTASLVAFDLLELDGKDHARRPH